eukprot:UN20356
MRLGNPIPTNLKNNWRALMIKNVYLFLFIMINTNPKVGRVYFLQNTIRKLFVVCLEKCKN